MSEVGERSETETPPILEEISLESAQELLGREVFDEGSGRETLIQRISGYNEWMNEDPRSTSSVDAIYFASDATGRRLDCLILVSPLIEEKLKDMGFIMAGRTPYRRITILKTISDKKNREKIGLEGHDTRILYDSATSFQIRGPVISDRNDEDSTVYDIGTGEDGNGLKIRADRERLREAISRNDKFRAEFGAMFPQ